MRGIEVETKASLLDGLDLIAAYAYTDSEVTKGNGPNLGKPLTYAPAALWAHHTIHEGVLAGSGFGGSAQ